MAGYFVAGDIPDKAKALYRADIADTVSKAEVDSAADPKPVWVGHCTNCIALGLLVSSALAPMVDYTHQNLAVLPTADSFAFEELVEDTAGALAAFEVARLVALVPIVVDITEDKLD